MTSSQLRPSKEILNLVRLINRLDKHSENMVIRLEEASDGSMPDGIQTEEWYWELKSLETVSDTNYVLIPLIPIKRLIPP